MDNPPPTPSPPPDVPALTEPDPLDNELSSLKAAIKQGDKQKAHSLLKKLSAAVEAPPKEDAPATDDAKVKEDRNYNTQVEAAETSRRYRQGAFARPLPTKPEVPEATDYGAFFGSK